MPFAMWTRALGGAHLSAQVGALLAMFFSGGGLHLGMPRLARSRYSLLYSPGGRSDAASGYQ